MPDVELARREGVELVRVGSWRVLSGSWNPNREDILAAVEAFQCPAIRRPRLKIGHLDPRFNTPAPDPQFDGQPALGWFDNLRAGESGDVLIADQLALPWLNTVQAAAYPDRSIEGRYGVVCALKHKHPFVIDAVSMLGETPPGIPTLKSIEDLPAFLGVAAAGDLIDEGRAVEVTVHAAAEVHTGAMVALIPTAEDAARLAVDGGEAAEELHVTLAYLGEAADLGDAGQQDIIDKVSTAANGLPQITADVFAVSVFNPGNAQPERDTCLVYGLSGDMLDAVHDLIDESLWGTPIPEQHRPWVAHLTAVYTADLSKVADLAGRMGPVTFDTLRLAFGGKHIDIPLIGQPEDLDVTPGDEVAAAEGNPEELKKYWLAGPGLKRWAGSRHPWTTLYRLLRKHIKNIDEAKRTASDWYREHFGHMPNQHVKASGSDSVDRAATEPGVPADGDPPPEPEQPLTEPLEPPVEAASSILPAAEPEPETPNPDPKEEDPVSTTDLSAFRSRLGLSDDADTNAVLEAFSAKLTEAENKQPEPTPEMVAASAAATEKAEKAEEAQTLLKEELNRLSGELATIKASAAATVKASFFQGLKTNGQLKPADEETWSARYDRDPEMVTEILTARAPGSEVPVMASGTTGPAEPEVDDEFEAMVARLDAPTGKAA